MIQRCDVCRTEGKVYNWREKVNELCPECKGKGWLGLDETYVPPPPKPWFTVRRHVAFTQAVNVGFCLHIGATAFFFGSWPNGIRVELLTPLHWFRISRCKTKERT